MYWLIARLMGWRKAWDFDEDPPIRVVWHPKFGIHYTGPGAWRLATTHGWRGRR